MNTFLQLFHSGKYHEALQRIQILLKASTKKYDIKIWKARTLLAMNAIDLSLSEANSAIIISPTRPEAIRIKARVLTMMGRYQQAIQALQMSEIADKDSAENYKLYGYALTKLKKYPEALQKYQKCISKNKINDPFSFIGKAETLVWLGSKNEAQKSIKYAIKAAQQQQNIKELSLDQRTSLSYCFRKYNEIVQMLKKIKGEVPQAHRKKIKLLSVQIESELIKQMSIALFLNNVSVFRAICIKYEQRISDEYDIDKTAASDSSSIFSCCFFSQQEN